MLRLPQYISHEVIVAGKRRQAGGDLTAVPVMKRAKRVLATSSSSAKKNGFFEAYSNPATDIIEPDGIERFCADINVDPSDRKVLLLAWKMRAKRMGYFTREEFQSGIAVLKATSAASVQRALPSLETEVDCNPDAYRDFCTFAFKYCLTEVSQKLIDIDTAITMLTIVMPQDPLVPRFCEFLKEQTEYKVVNFDQWTSFLRFSQEMKPDLSDYKEEDAWPILLDNFVAWSQEQNN